MFSVGGLPRQAHALTSFQKSTPDQSSWRLSAELLEKLPSIGSMQHGLDDVDWRSASPASERSSACYSERDPSKIVVCVAPSPGGVTPILKKESDVRSSVVRAVQFSPVRYETPFDERHPAKTIAQIEKVAVACFPPK